MRRLAPYVLMFAVGLSVRIVGLEFGLPGALARPDEETIVRKALLLEETGSWNPQFFAYPSLMIYAAYGAFEGLLWTARLFGATDADTLVEFFTARPELFHLTLRWISAICGALTPLALFVAAWRLYGRRTALLAGWALVFCYLHVRDSHFGVTDVPCVFLSVLAFWQLTDYVRAGRRRGLWWAAVLAGLAIGTKYTAAALVWPFAVAMVLALCRRPEPRRWRTIGRHTLLAACITLLSFAASTPYFFLDFDRAWADVSWEVMLLRKEAAIVPGMNGYIDHFRISLWYGMGWPILLAAAAGGVLAIVRRSRRGLLVWSLPVMYYVTTAGTHRVFVRHMDIVLPFLAIAAGWAVRSAYVSVRQRLRSRSAPRRLPPWLAYAVLAILLIPSATRIVELNRVLRRTDTRIELRAWILEHVDPRDPILWSGGWSALPYMLHHQPIRAFAATEKLLPEHPSWVDRYPWIIFVEWPVAYYEVDAPGMVARRGNNRQERAFLLEAMGANYTLVHGIDPHKATLPVDAVPRLDHFFMSYSDPGLIDRPGPGFHIYRRTTNGPEAFR